VLTVVINQPATTSPTVADHISTTLTVTIQTKAIAHQAEARCRADLKRANTAAARKVRDRINRKAKKVKKCEKLKALAALKRQKNEKAKAKKAKKAKKANEAMKRVTLKPPGHKSCKWCGVCRKSPPGA